jgi:hypothetical protein
VSTFFSELLGRTARRGRNIRESLPSAGSADYSAHIRRELRIAEGVDGLTRAWALQIVGGCEGREGLLDGLHFLRENVG